MLAYYCYVSDAQVVDSKDVAAGEAPDGPIADADAPLPDVHEQSEAEEELDFQRPASLAQSCAELFDLLDPDRVVALLGFTLGPRWSYSIPGAAGEPATMLGRIEEWGGARTGGEGTTTSPFVANRPSSLRVQVSRRVCLCLVCDRWRVGDSFPKESRLPISCKVLSYTTCEAESES